MTDPIRALAEIVGSQHCLTEANAKAPFLTDWRGIYHGGALAILMPSDTAQVQAIMAIARQHRLPIVPQGGNTGMAGAATPDDSGRALLLSLRRLNRIRGIDPLNNTIEVEAGCLLADVQTAAGSLDRLFPLSLSAEGSCTIGGNLATNAGGINVLRYGMTRELTLGLEVVLADGSLLSDLKALRKDNTGYDLKQLFIGSEGTLGVITAAMLKLFPRPRHRLTALVALATLEAAPGLLSRCRASCADQITSFELLPRLGFDLARRVYPDLTAPFERTPDYSILIEIATSAEGVNLATLAEQCLAEALSAGEIADAVIAQSNAQARDLWLWREGMVEGQRLDGPGIKHDIAIPVARVPEFITRANAIMAATHPEMRVLAFGHLGDGNIHYNLLQIPGSIPAATPGQGTPGLTATVNSLIHDLVEEMGGSISAEHGIGQLRWQEFQTRASPVELGLMRAIKAAFDPEGLMNPGKVL